LAHARDAQRRGARLSAALGVELLGVEALGVEALDRRGWYDGRLDCHVFPELIKILRI
jgi:hypothetical protein